MKIHSINAYETMKPSGSAMQALTGTSALKQRLLLKISHVITYFMIFMGQFTGDGEFIWPENCMKIIKVIQIFLIVHLK